MTAETRLFGKIDIEDDKLITFPEGIVGFPFLEHFALIHDEDNKESAIMWLQSMEEPEFAMPVVEPQRVVDGYNPVINDDLLAPAGDLKPEQTYVLVTLTVPREIEKMSVNLKAPIIINMENNKAVQLIVEDEYEVKHYIYDALKKRKEGGSC